MSDKRQNTALFRANIGATDWAFLGRLGKGLPEKIKNKCRDDFQSSEILDACGQYGARKVYQIPWLSAHSWAAFAIKGIIPLSYQVVQKANTWHRSVSRPKMVWLEATNRTGTATLEPEKVSTVMTHSQELREWGQRSEVIHLPGAGWALHGLWSPSPQGNQVSFWQEIQVWHQMVALHQKHDPLLCILPCNSGSAATAGTTVDPGNQDSNRVVPAQPTALFWLSLRRATRTVLSSATTSVHCFQPLWKGVFDLPNL